MDPVIDPSNLTTPVKFTVLIPTRERCDTLAATLKTCVGQDYADLEIIVSDNFSQDNTRAVVDSFKDSRIRYVNTGKRVGMSANWEFALSQARGDYVTIIGDDDGLLPDALMRLSRLITQLERPSAIVWKAAAYGWPTHITESERNRLVISLGQTLKRLSAPTILHEVIHFKTLYFLLPNLYNSFVRADVIQRVKNESGAFFHSVTPDIYSGIALACVMDSYYYSLRAYSVNGASHHSNGASQLGEWRNLQTHQKYETENDLAFHPSLVTAPAVSILTAEAALQAKEHMPTARAILDVDIKEALLYAVKVAAIQSPAMYQTVADTVKKIGQLNNLKEYAEAVLAQNPNRPKDNRAIVGYNLAFNSIRLSTDDFGVKDIYDACQLCHHILVLNERGYHTPRGIAEATLRLGLKFIRGGGDHFVRAQKLGRLR
jgi:glycosyltransferase involved in cell wall biosynthesis